MARGARASRSRAVLLAAGAVALCATGASFVSPGVGSLPSQLPRAHRRSLEHGVGTAARTSRLPRAAGLEDFATGALAVAAGLAGFSFLRSSLERHQNDETRKAAEAAERRHLAKMRERAHIEPRDEPWTLEELQNYDGSHDEDGPILMAVDGEVLNVWQGRHFYAPGGAYHIFAGRDATRLLAKGLLEEEEDDDDAAKPLSLAEKAALQSWIWTLKAKYEVVGTFADSVVDTGEAPRTATA